MVRFRVDNKGAFLPILVFYPPDDPFGVLHVRDVDRLHRVGLLQLLQLAHQLLSYFLLAGVVLCFWVESLSLQEDPAVVLHLQGLQNFEQPPRRVYPIEK